MSTIIFLSEDRFQTRECSQRASNYSHNTIYMQTII